MRCKRLMAAGALAAVLAVSGCSGGGGPKVATLGANNSSSSSSGSGDAKQSFQDAMVAYTKCMREHGIDMPDPKFSSADGGGGGGFAVLGGPPPDGASGADTNAAAGADGAAFDPNREDFKAADAACKPILDAATKDLPKPSPEELAKQRDQALAFAKCMREHGIDMPDPTFDDNGGMTMKAGGDGAKGDPGSVAGPSQAFQDAAKACQADGKGGGFVVSGGPAGAK